MAGTGKYSKIRIADPAVGRGKRISLAGQIPGSVLELKRFANSFRKTGFWLNPAFGLKNSTGGMPETLAYISVRYRRIF